jgi:nitrogen fixation NifU-like protein
MTEYEQKLLDHFMNPRNVGSIEKPDGYGRAQNPVNGYLTDIYLRITNDCITDIKFKTFGCVVTIASASALSVAVKGKTISEIVDSKNPLETLLGYIKKEMGDTPQKNWHCSPAAAQTLLISLADYYRKNKNEERVKKIEKILTDVQRYFETEIKIYEKKL